VPKNRRLVYVAESSGSLSLMTQPALAAGVSEVLTKPVQSREIAITLARVPRLRSPTPALAPDWRGAP
jgi:hypothetical protein